MVSVEPGEGGLEGEFLSCALQFLDEIGGSCEQDPVSVLDQFDADGGREMGFSGAGRAETEQVHSLLEPSVSGCEGEDPGFGEGWHGGELEPVEALAGRQASLAEMALLAPPVALGEFVLGEGGQQAGGRDLASFDSVPVSPAGRWTQSPAHRLAKLMRSTESPDSRLYP